MGTQSPQALRTPKRSAGSRCVARTFSDWDVAESSSSLRPKQWTRSSGGARRALQGVVCLAEPGLSGRDPHPGTDCQDLLSMSWAWRRPVVVADHCRQPSGDDPSSEISHRPSWSAVPSGGTFCPRQTPSITSPMPYAFSCGETHRHE